MIKDEPALAESLGKCDLAEPVGWGQSDYGQLVPKTTRTQDNSYPRQLVPRTTRTQDNSYPGRLVPKTTRTQDNSYPGQLVPRTTRTHQFGYYNIREDNQN